MKKIVSFMILAFLVFGTVAAGEEMKPKGSLSEGISLFKSGDYQASYAMLSRLFQAYPENLELNFYLGRGFGIGKNGDSSFWVDIRVL